jgi:hypothetical protein
MESQNWRFRFGSFTLLTAAGAVMIFVRHFTPYLVRAVLGVLAIGTFHWIAKAVC